MASLTGITASGGAQPVPGDTGPAQSRDSALIDIYNTLSDETGRYSDQDKLAAWRRVQELSQATDAQRPYGFAGYSTKDIQLLNQLQSSSFMRAQQSLTDRMQKLGESIVHAGKRDSANLQSWIDFYDSLSPMDKGLLDIQQPDFRETHAALKKVFSKLEADIDAGRFTWRTAGQVKDADIRAALLMIDKLQDTDLGRRKSARDELDTLLGGFGDIRDSISLSAAAQATLVRYAQENPVAAV